MQVVQNVCFDVHNHKNWYQKLRVLSIVHFCIKCINIYEAKMWLDGDFFSVQYLRLTLFIYRHCSYKTL